jgi:hypothetical protein
MSQERKKITIAEEDVGKLTDLKWQLKQVQDMQKEVFPGITAAKLVVNPATYLPLGAEQVTKVLTLLEADIKSSIAALISAP